MSVFITQNISIITCPKSALALILSTGQQQVFSYKVIIRRTAADSKKQLLSKIEAINVKANKKERRENESPYLEKSAPPQLHHFITK